MLPILTLLLVLGLSLVVTRVASVALVHTGLGLEAARFQARSALTGVGFTTTEAEEIVGHPVRRRIVGWLMLFGSVGFVTATSTVLLSFLDIGAGMGLGVAAAEVSPEASLQAWRNLGLLVLGIAFLIWFAHSRFVDRWLSRAIRWALRRWTDIDARDYASLLHLREDYGVSELRVAEEDWLAGRTVADAALLDEGVLVLGIECPGSNFIGAPPPSTSIHSGDRLLLYGRSERIRELDLRCQGVDGDSAHESAMAERDALATTERARAGR